MGDEPLLPPRRRVRSRDTLGRGAGRGARLASPDDIVLAYEGPAGKEPDFGGFRGVARLRLHGRTALSPTVAEALAAELGPKAGESPTRHSVLVYHRDYPLAGRGLFLKCNEH